MKILGYEYTVKACDHLKDFANQEARKLEILYSTDQARQMKESCILHEIIEALNYHLELKLEHEQIMGLEAGLYGTLTDAGVNLSVLLP